MFNLVGFVDAELVSETGFNSSAVTKGMLFRATKPLSSKGTARFLMAAA